MEIQIARKEKYEIKITNLIKLLNPSKCLSNNQFYPNISLSKHIYIYPSRDQNIIILCIIVLRESRMIDKMVHPFACLASTRCGNVPWSGTLMAMAATLGRSRSRSPAFPLEDRGDAEGVRERARERGKDETTRGSFRGGVVSWTTR